MIARLDRSDAGADLHHNGAAFMAHDRGEEPFGILSREGESIGVANSGRGNL